jgi:hypothetical protein
MRGCIENTVVSDEQPSGVDGFRIQH